VVTQRSEFYSVKSNPIILNVYLLYYIRSEPEPCSKQCMDVMQHHG